MGQKPAFSVAFIISLNDYQSAKFRSCVSIIRGTDMPSVLSRFQVTGLYGFKHFDLELIDNTLIIVGENGSGKTTLLRMLFYFLSGRWQSLIQFRFQSISVTIDDQEFPITREELVKAFSPRGRRFLSDFPPSERDRLRDMIALGDMSRLREEVFRTGIRIGLPIDRLEDLALSYIGEEIGPVEGAASSPKAIQTRMRAVQSAMGAQILYLPTYRRIERELNSIFEGPISEDLGRHRQRQRETDSSYIELVEFGMKDVHKAVNSAVIAIRDFVREDLNRITLGYLKDVVNQSYLDIDMRAIEAVPEHTVRSVIDRIDESILNKYSKEHLFQVINSLASKSGTTEHDKIVFHYFLVLLRFHEALQERERGISDFCDLCSEYISDKQFMYNSSTFSFSIAARDRKKVKQNIELADLSSGEKQIVSLFSHLYLSGATKFFVLIDEPELSLSVPWQRRFLPDIRRGQFCTGLVAVTHSPFIYDNSLRSYARSVGEFGAN
jgi:predicted ATPase